MSDSFVTVWNIARQALLSMGFSREEYWSGLPCSPPRHLPDAEIKWASQVALVIKNSPDNVGDLRNAGLILGSGRSPGGGHGNPVQYSCLENPMDRGAWWAMVHRITELDTTEAIQHACTHTYEF